MASERFINFLDELISGIPLDHPDNGHFVQVREEHRIYSNSSDRAFRLNEHEGRILIAKNAKEREVMAEEILPVVAEVFEIPIVDIVGVSKKQPIVIARFAASHLFFTLCNLGSSEIGERMGRNHSTIIHHIRRSRGLIKTDPVFIELVAQAKNTLLERISAPKPQL